MDYIDLIMITLFTIMVLMKVLCVYKMLLVKWDEEQV